MALVWSFVDEKRSDHNLFGIMTHCEMKETRKGKEESERQRLWENKEWNKDTDSHEDTEKQRDRKSEKEKEN